MRIAIIGVPGLGEERLQNMFHKQWNMYEYVKFSDESESISDCSSSYACAKISESIIGLLILSTKDVDTNVAASVNESNVANNFFMLTSSFFKLISILYHNFHITSREFIYILVEIRCVFLCILYKFKHK